MKDQEHIAAILTQIAYDLAIASLVTDKADSRANKLQTFHQRARHALPDIQLTFGRAYNMLGSARTGPQAGPKESATGTTMSIDFALVGQCGACNAQHKIMFSTVMSGKTIPCECGQGDISVSSERLRLAQQALADHKAAQERKTNG